MLPFNTIPLIDITSFLEENNQCIVYTQVHNDAYNFMMKYPLLPRPESVQDWFIAKNNDLTELQPIYSSWIYFASTIELNNLSNLIFLDEVNKQRILRILYYKQKLIDDMHNYDNLSIDLIKGIAQYLDYKSILLLSNISHSFAKLRLPNHLWNILQVSLESSTGLNTSLFNLNQLLYLAQQIEYIPQVNIPNDEIILLDDRGEIHIMKYFPEHESNLKFIEGGIFNFSYCLFLMDDCTIHFIECNRNREEISHLKNIIHMAAGLNHSLCLDYDGKVYGFGDNSSKQIINNREEIIFQPTLIPDINRIIKVGVGLDYSVFLQGNGELYFNGYGNGLIRIPINRDIIDISVGFHHALFLMDNYRICYWQPLSTSIYPVIIVELEKVMVFTASNKYSLFTIEGGRFYIGRIIDNSLKITLDRRISQVVYMQSYIDKSICITKKGKVYMVCYNTEAPNYLNIEQI